MPQDPTLFDEVTRDCVRVTRTHQRMLTVRAGLQLGPLHRGGGRGDGEPSPEDCLASRLAGVAPSPVGIFVRQLAGDPTVHTERQNQQAHDEAEHDVRHPEVEEVGLPVQNEQMVEAAHQEERPYCQVQCRGEVPSHPSTYEQGQTDDHGDRAESRVGRHACDPVPRRAEGSQSIGEAQGPEDEQNASAQSRTGAVHTGQVVIYGEFVPELHRGTPARRLTAGQNTIPTRRSPALLNMTIFFSDTVTGTPPVEDGRNCS